MEHTLAPVVLLSGDDKDGVIGELGDVVVVVAGGVGYAVEVLEELDDTLVEREPGGLEGIRVSHFWS